MADTEKTEAQLKTAAYGKAVARLKEKYQEDFRALVKEEMAKVGVEWSPRLSDEEKAARDIEAIYAKFPGLKSQS